MRSEKGRYSRVQFPMSCERCRSSIMKGKTGLKGDSIEDEAGGEGWWSGCLHPQLHDQLHLLLSQSLFLKKHQPTSFFQRDNLSKLKVFQNECNPESIQTVKEAHAYPPPSHPFRSKRNISPALYRTSGVIFLSTTAQLYVTHRRGGRRRKRHSSSTQEWGHSGMAWGDCVSQAAQAEWCYQDTPPPPP